MEQSKFYQIKNITEQEYTLVGCDGSVITRPIQDVDKSASAFTIQDAKDGDVLYCESSGIKYIIISKGINEHGNIDSYFRYNSINGFGIDVPSVLSAKRDSITPATKEQRKQLEKVMADAGYTFDFEKKELKKILQRIISAEVKEAMYDKPAWSEEDDDNMMMIEDSFSDYLDYIREDSSLTKHRKNTLKEEVIGYVNWLKSLKERVQPKQEWSEQEQVKINRIVAYLENLNIADNDILLKDVAWLKSIRPQPQWRPSDEQMDALCYVTNFDYGGHKATLVSLYEQLKKLKA